MSSVVSPAEIPGSDSSTTGPSRTDTASVAGSSARAVSSVRTWAIESPPLRAHGRRRGITQTALPYFVSGPENRLASLACAGDVDVFSLGNPVLVIGPSGSGKTTVMLHLANRALIASRSTSIDQPSIDGEVLYISAVDFAKDYAESVAAEDVSSLADRLDRALVLVVDDVHSIADKPSAQAELARRIEHRCDRGKAVLVSFRHMPQETRGISTALASRCSPGLTIPLSVPGPLIRQQLLSELAATRDIELTSDQLKLLDAKLETGITVPGMAASINQLDLWCRMNESGIDAQAIESSAKHSRQSRDLSLQAITQAVGRHFKIRVTDLRSSTRRKQIMRARSLAMWLARQCTSMSLQQIGDYFGGRDHTTVMHAVRQIDSLMDADAVIRRAANELREKLR
ncbi:MAG: helix-turn-helix domain-containing protein [Planctomycetota bacterium]